MNNNKIKKLAVASAFLALTACTNESGIDTDVEPGAITIQATIGSMTKVEHKGNASKFTPQDTIVVYGWTSSADSVPAAPEVDGVRYGLGTDGKWTTESNTFWNTPTDKYYFLGIYPVPDSVTSFKAAAYKLDPADYSASDLLIATNLDGVKATDGAVKLTFEHVMAKLNVNLKFRAEFDTVPAVSSVTVMAKSAATVNYLTKEVTATGTPLSVLIPEAAVPSTGFDVSFSGLQVPQEGVNKITVTIANRVFVYTAVQDIPLEAGKYTTLGLIVGNEKIELDAVSVTDWTADATIGLSEAKELIYSHNGHEYVDLGLPSGLLWATCNIGALTFDDYGDYYAWAETEPYYDEGYAREDPMAHWKDDKSDGYDWTSYTWCQGSYNTMTKYFDYSFAGLGGDNISEIVPEDDAAHVIWSGSWRMPAKAEWDELKNNCTWTLKTTADGYSHNGVLVTSNINGNSIFLPAAGSRVNKDLEGVGSVCRYWTNSLRALSGPEMASYISYDSGTMSTSSCYRKCGLPVRPVFRKE